MLNIKKFWIILIIVVVVVTTLSITIHTQISKQPEQKTSDKQDIPQEYETLYVSLDEDFTLYKNQSAIIEDEDYEIKIVDFLNSPCPKEVVCIFSGLAVNFEYTHNGEIKNHDRGFGFETKVIESDYETYAKVRIEKIKPKLNQTAKYKIEFIARWSEDTHPNYYTEDAHFSPFVAYSHTSLKESYIFENGELPTPGVEEMSETGKTDILIKEIQDMIDVNYAHKQTKGSRIDSPGNDFSEINVSGNYRYVTFVSMLAPSPDWFVSASANLSKDDGQWIDRVELDLVTYDSGGDDGEELDSEDLDSKPKQPITVFDKKLQNLGKIILTRIDE